MPELPDYLDFDIEIGPGAGRDYPLRFASPAGQARLAMRFPFDDLALDNRLLKLENALLKSDGKRRLNPSGEERPLRCQPGDRARRPPLELPVLLVRQPRFSGGGGISHP